jgi:hypothetical protein
MLMGIVAVQVSDLALPKRLREGAAQQNLKVAMLLIK